MERIYVQIVNMMKKSNYLEIYSSKQVCIDTENVEMNVINVFGVNVDKGK